MATQPELLTVDDEDMMICSKCQTRSFEERKSGPHTGLYCSNCGKWIKWIVQEVVYDPDYILPFG